MKMTELTKVMEVLGVSDEGVENLSDARSRIRSALYEGEKTSDWSPGKVRYFSVSEGFRTVTSFAGSSVSFKRSDIPWSLWSYATSNCFGLLLDIRTRLAVNYSFYFDLFHVMIKDAPGTFSLPWSWAEKLCIFVLSDKARFTKHLWYKLYWCTLIESLPALFKKQSNSCLGCTFSYGKESSQYFSCKKCAPFRKLIHIIY